MVALILAVPDTVAAAYTVVLLALIFVEGFRVVVRDGIDPRKAMIVGISFWMGMGFENEAIFADLLSGPVSALLGNGMASGAICAMALTIFLEFMSSRRRSLNTELGVGVSAQDR